MTSPMSSVSVRSMASRSMPGPRPAGGRHAVLHRLDELEVQGVGLVVVTVGSALLAPR